MAGQIVAERPLIPSEQRYVRADRRRGREGVGRGAVGGGYRLGEQTRLSFILENVFDKNYWQSAAREGLTIGAPRTFLVSVSADF